ncbi:MAG TPA: hypothetical protein PLN69_02210 [bacterium]|nr:hypothetical protein [bacterium]
MKKLLIASILFLTFCVSVRAQIIPDTIFDDQSQAFGNTIQDVAPDILDVKIVNARSGELGSQVKAKVWVDPEKSKFKVKEVFAYYSTGQSNTVMDRISFNPIEGEEYWWSADISAPGEKIEVFLGATDELGNAVQQLPEIDSLNPEKSIKIIHDGLDSGIDKILDIDNVSFGFSGEYMVSCIEMGNAFQSYSEKGANALVIGFVPEDLRFDPSRSCVDNNAGFVGYLPALGISGVFNLNNVEQGTKPEGEAVIKMSGNKVCMKNKISTLTSTPERGLKVFAATGAINAVSDEVIFVDATPYAILYFGGYKQAAD